jgi:ribosomal protein S18 acetylase RimI-like enzyme
MRGLYAEVYAEPPYNEGPQHAQRFTEHFAAEVGRHGFALAMAMDAATLAGAAYGWTMAAGQWWRSSTSEPPEQIRAVPKFAIMEWMVRGPYRRQGIGRRLLDLLLAERPEPYAVLASNPQAPARKIYDRLGWQYCGRSKPDLLPPMDLLALRLTDAP